MVGLASISAKASPTPTVLQSEFSVSDTMACPQHRNCLPTHQSLLALGVLHESSITQTLPDLRHFLLLKGQVMSAFVSSDMQHVRAVPVTYLITPEQMCFGQHWELGLWGMHKPALKLHSFCSCGKLHM